MPKLSGSFGPSFRSDRRATRASSIVRSICIGSRGFTVSSRLRRDPNSFWNVPSGITMNSSCELPKSEPFSSLTPITRKWTPRIWMLRSIGVAPLKSRSAVP